MLTHQWPGSDGDGTRMEGGREGRKDTWKKGIVVGGVIGNIKGADQIAKLRKSGWWCVILG